MNKGLFIHIMATIVYIAIVLFILQDSKTDVSDRFLIAALFICVHVFISAYAGLERLYDKKL